MPVSISDHLGLAPGAIESLGAFDAILDVDSRLFIDPWLARKSAAPEFKRAAKTLDKRFGDLILLLGRSKARGDAAWRAAFGLLNFRELPGLCIGYSRNSTAGLGIGAKLRARLLVTAKDIVDAGIDDPRFFELMGLLEEGIGADRISDMTARILAHEIGAYSGRVFKELGVEGEVLFWVGDKSYHLPRNPFSYQPILLLPMDVLRALPVAESWADIDSVIAFNAELRSRVNDIIGTTWAKAKYFPKGVLRERLLRDPELFRSVIEAYAGVKGQPYDFAGDPLGEVQWYGAAKLFTERFPLNLTIPKKPTAADITKVVLLIARQFEELVEDNGLWKLLYNEDGTPKIEDAAQLLFFGIAWNYCIANDTDISPETDSGRGEVDFKFSKGMKAKTVVETKLTSNTKLVSGMEVQLDIYARGERTDEKVYLVVDVAGTGNDTRLATFNRAVEERRTAGKRLPVIIHINARPKASASKAKTVT